MTHNKEECKRVEGLHGEASTGRGYFSIMRCKIQNKKVQDSNAKKLLGCFFMDPLLAPKYYLNPLTKN